MNMHMANLLGPDEFQWTSISDTSNFNASLM